MFHHDRARNKLMRIVYLGRSISLSSVPLLENELKDAKRKHPYHIRVKIGFSSLVCRFGLLLVQPFLELLYGGIDPLLRTSHLSYFGVGLSKLIGKIGLHILHESPSPLILRIDPVHSAAGSLIFGSLRHCTPIYDFIITRLLRIEQQPIVGVIEVICSLILRNVL